MDKSGIGIIKALSQVLPSNPQWILMAIAMQIEAAGGLDKHLKTMSPDSEWAMVIYPQLKDGQFVRTDNE